MIPRVAVPPSSLDIEDPFDLVQDVSRKFNPLCFSFVFVFLFPLFAASCSSSGESHPKHHSEEDPSLKDFVVAQVSQLQEGTADSLKPAGPTEKPI
jgi:hypothetical protein